MVCLRSAETHLAGHTYILRLSSVDGGAGGCRTDHDHQWVSESKLHFKSKRKSSFMMLIQFVSPQKDDCTVSWTEFGLSSPRSQSMMHSFTIQNFFLFFSLLREQYDFVFSFSVEFVPPKYLWEDLVLRDTWPWTWPVMLQKLRQWGFSLVNCGLQLLPQPSSQQQLF